MWKCENCTENIEDRYKNCWNCGTAKSPSQEVKYHPKSIKISAKLLPEVEPSQKAETSQPEIKTPSPAKTSPPIETKKVEPEFEAEIPAIEKTVYNNEFLSDYKPQSENTVLSKLKTFVLLIFWLAIFVSATVFAYLSYQRMNNFEKKLSADFESFKAHKDQFIFPQNTTTDRRNRTPIEGNLKTKVLPLNLKDKEVNSLFTVLPDDLRPGNLDEVKTVMWIDCNAEVVNRYQDGSTGYRDNCKVFLVDKESSKFIGVQDFIGVMPALAKKGEGDAFGRVLPEKYIAYLREKQTENERGTAEFASDSANHHFYNKSEFLYAVLLSGFLGAIGFGWLVFIIKAKLSGRQ